MITSKIVSKAEGRTVDLRTVEPSARARELAELTEKDPQLVELILRESTEIVRAVPNTLLVRHRLGFMSANAAIDRSNADGSEHTALLMPLDPDASARRIHDALEACVRRRDRRGDHRHARSPVPARQHRCGRRRSPGSKVSST